MTVRVLVGAEEHELPLLVALAMVRQGTAELSDQSEENVGRILDAHGERVRQQLAVVSGAAGGPTMSLHDAMKRW